jgi:uncharacterized RDD family membrane protein YckC
MNQPPFGPGQDPTQPIPVRQYSPSPPIPPPPPRGRGVPPQAGFVPIFGNVPLYLIARFLAFAIDIGAIGFVVAAFAFNATERGFVTLAGRSESGFATLCGSAIAVALLFAFLCEALFGATLGKAIFGLRVHRASGGHAGVVRVFARYLLRPIDIVLVGPLLALATPRHQRLGDFLGGTVVSRYRFGPLASIVGVGLLVAIAYAQAVFGGGFTTALDLTAEGANYGPDLLAKTAGLVGLFVPHAAPVESQPSTPVPTDAPTVPPSNAPSASSTPIAPAAEPSDAPSDEATATATEEPLSDPTSAPPVEHI